MLPQVRILGLWSAARGVSPGEDASWARVQAQRVGACPEVAALALHSVTSAAVPHPQPCGWCLELRLAQGHEPSEVLASGAFAEFLGDMVAEFLGDMRLLGMRRQVLAVDGELP
jgi:hypothetical protein